MQVSLSHTSFIFSSCQPGILCAVPAEIENCLMAIFILCCVKQNSTLALLGFSKAGLFSLPSSLRTEVKPEWEMSAFSSESSSLKYCCSNRYYFLFWKSTRTLQPLVKSLYCSFLRQCLKQSMWAYQCSEILSAGCK